MKKETPEEILKRVKDDQAREEVWTDWNNFLTGHPSITKER